MKNLFYLLPRLLLVGCLILYGPLGMATAGAQGAVFSMEICADGVVKTVVIGADGIPVEPFQDCNKCLTCCSATEAQPDVPCGAHLSISLLEVEIDLLRIQNLRFQNRNIRPMPRGPPAPQLSMLFTPTLINTDQDSSSFKMRSDGRPIFKDATS